MKVQRFVWVLLLFLTQTAVNRMYAEGSEALLQGIFRPIQTIEDITDEDYYLIIGIASDAHTYLLTNTTYKENKLYAEQIDTDGIPSTLSIDKANAIWQIRKTGNHTFVFQSAENNKYILAEKETTTLTTSSNKSTEWVLESTGTAFRIQNAQDEERYLSISNFFTYTVFGHYISADSKDLYIYKLARQMADIPGEATQPKNGTTVGLYTDGYVADKNLTPLSDANYLLRDGTLASDEQVGQWTCHWVDEGFVLERADKIYLDYNLQHTSTPIIWKVSNGYLATNEANPRYLVFNESWQLLPSDAFLDSQTQTCLLLPFAASPQKEEKNNTLVLSGGWTATDLSHLKWENCQALDLTGIALPCQAHPFDFQPENSFIYVSKEDVDFVPKSWNLTVGCTEDYNYLVQKAQLTDKQALYIDREIQVPAGLLTYTRAAYADGFWETLYLPFDASLPEVFQAEELESFNQSQGELLFSPTTQIESNQPLIIRYIGNPNNAANTTFQVTNKECTLHPTNEYPTPTNHNFIGTYSPLLFDGERATPIYLLNATGESFVRAAAGSSLAPFRAYLTGSNETKSIKVIHTMPTSTLTVHPTQDTATAPCYRINGTLYSSEMTEAGISQLPAGIYIWKGKTIIQKR